MPEALGTSATASHFSSDLDKALGGEVDHGGQKECWEGCWDAVGSCGCNFLVGRLCAGSLGPAFSESKSKGFIQCYFPSTFHSGTALVGCGSCLSMCDLVGQGTVAIFLISAMVKSALQLRGHVSGFSMALTARYVGEYGLCPAPALNMSTASPVHDLLITSPLSPTGTPHPHRQTDNPLPPRQATPKTMELSKPSFVVPPPRTLATQSIYATPTTSSIPFLSLSPSTDRHTPPAPVADRPTASKSLQRACPLPPFPVLGCVCVCVCVSESQ